MPDLWERQPWETPTSYSRFVEYYLPQEQRRSLDKAYRRHRAHTSGKPVAKNLRAPGYWTTWSRGRDYKGDDIKGASTWEERADAWDNKQVNSHIHKIEDDREQQRVDMQRFASAAFGKVAEAWTQFKPAPGDEYKLTELTQALRVVMSEMRKAYGLEDPTRIEVNDWRSEVFALLSKGIITIDDVRDDLGDELAREIFEFASQKAD